MPPETRPLLGGAAGEGPGAAGRGWRDAVPGKRCWVLVKKVKTGLPSRVPPMYSSLGLGPVAALPASVPLSALRSWSSGGGKGCIPHERKLPGGARASGRGASVWQVSEAADIGVSSRGKSSWLCPAAARDASGAFGPTLRLSCLHVPPPLPAPHPVSGLQLALALLVPRSHTVGGGRDAGRPPHPSWLLMKRSVTPTSRLLRVRWVGRPPLLFSHLPIFLVSIFFFL